MEAKHYVAMRWQFASNKLPAAPKREPRWTQLYTRRSASRLAFRMSAPLLQLGHFHLGSAAALLVHPPSHASVRVDVWSGLARLGLPRAPPTLSASSDRSCRSRLLAGPALDVANATVISEALARGLTGGTPVGVVTIDEGLGFALRTLVHHSAEISCRLLVEADLLTTSTHQSN